MSEPLQRPGAGEVDPWAAQVHDRFFKAAMLHARLQRFRSTLRKRWWILFLSLLMIGGPAVYYAVVKPVTYESEATMWMVGKLNLPEGRLYAEELSSYMGTQAELIESRPIRLRALEKVAARFPGIVPAGTKAVLEALPFDLKVKSSVKSSTLELRATGPSREATRVFLDEIMAEYRAFKGESRQRTSSNALTTITDQIKEIEKQVQEQQDRLTSFQTTNNISFLSESGLSAGSHLSKLNELLSDLRTEFRLLELLTPEQFRDMARNPEGVSTGVSVPGEKTAQMVAMSSAGPQSAYYQALQQLQLLVARREEFAQVLRPAHSKMVKLNQEIGALEKLLATLRDQGEQQALSQMANRKKSLELQIQNLENQYRSWETNAGEANRKLAEHDRLKQQLARSQALYDRLLGLVQSVDLNQNLDQESLSALAPASAARASLTKYKLGAAGVLLALLMGGGLVMLLSLADDRFTSLTELSLHLPEDVVGQIPESIVARRNSRRRRLRHPEDQHAFAESFRNLRSSLLSMTGSAARPKVFLVTSAVPKEGKTTVAANLAAALAMAGVRVLLVDADLRRSTLHKVLGVRLTPGLREVLSQSVTAAEATVQTHEANLFLMPAGEAETSSSEAFLRRPLDLLLQQVAGEYEYVVIDTAPVLATDDVASLGPKTDGVFMVVRASYTSSRMTREALERLHKRRIKVLGVIYNRARAASDYYYRYSSDYYSAKDAGALPVAAAPKAGGKKQR